MSDLNKEVLNLAAITMTAYKDRVKGLEKSERNMVKLFEAMTADKRDFPKAVKIGELGTDIATLKLCGDEDAIEINTGADGSYSVYADNYSGPFPGRIIIEIHHPAQEGGET